MLPSRTIAVGYLSLPVNAESKQASESKSNVQRAAMSSAASRCHVRMTGGDVSAETSAKEVWSGAGLDGLLRQRVRAVAREADAHAVWKSAVVDLLDVSVLREGVPQLDDRRNLAVGAENGDVTASLRDLHTQTALAIHHEVALSDGFVRGADALQTVTMMKCGAGDGMR